ncbi:MAG: TauD/TfdA family dioxygenase [Gammaproteobacteria bacterium]|nr:TauD/TfdA family dioxygenase [Gammaproteobacteria bacterium]
MTVSFKEHGLTVPLTQGQIYFNYCWLRDNCPSSFDPQTRERIFDICSLAENPVALSAELSIDELVVHWANENHTSRFSLTWLEKWAKPSLRDDVAALPRSLWKSDHSNKLAKFNADTLSTNRTKLTQYAHALIVDGIALISGLEDSNQALTRLANLLGSVRPSVPGDYFDVRVHLDPVNLSYTASELELHTDTPAEELPPGIQFLHCRSNTVKGGVTVFLDGAAVAEDFRQSNPEDFEILSTTKIPFYYEHDNFDWRSRQKVIELDDRGNVSGLTISQHMADVNDLPQKELDSFYPALLRFGRLLRSEKYQIQIRLEEGQCIVFDNHRIVHGREAYAENSGNRYLRGCYIDRGELRSSYRTLIKKQK